MSAAIRCVLFDLDGVLADYDRGTRVDVLARRLDRDPEAIHAAIYESGTEDLADAGRLDTPAYLSALGRALDCTVDADAWVEARRGATLFVDDNATNVAGAGEAGLIGHRFIDPAQLRRDLAARGIA